ncbi:uncharacterized protein LOC142566586 [Dermacentor variabilis]|uniref:uncharacterized protein LOC142566586 n=1 Tax=Dermacentor variabilis TaxID=34621 RepID=UPI003F5B6685
MPDRGQERVHRFRDHVVAGVNWRPTRLVDDVPSSLVCGLCRMIPKRTVLLPCGHALCQSCLEGSVGRCPLDQVQFEEAECVGCEFPGRTANTLKVYCWNEAHGCEYTGTMDSMLEHYENECTFHIVECLRCGEGVQHRDLPTHYAAGCSAGVSTAITESSQPTELTLEDVNAALEDLKATLGCLNHDQLLPVIQSQLNELKEEVRNQEASFAEITREVTACEHNLKAEMDQMTATISSNVSHKLTALQNSLEEASASRSLSSLRSEQDLILRKLEHLAHLEHSRKTSPKPDSSSVIAHCELWHGSVRHLTSALTTPARIEEIRWSSYLLNLENCEGIIQWQGGNKKFAEITVWHMRDTYFTIAVWKYRATPASSLIVEIEFNGTLVDSKCWPPFWNVRAVDKVTSNERSLTSRSRPCWCKGDDPSLQHFHLEFRIDIASLKNDGYLRDGKIAFRIVLSDREEADGIRAAH